MLLKSTLRCWGEYSQACRGAALTGVLLAGGVNARAAGVVTRVESTEVSSVYLLAINASGQAAGFGTLTNTSASTAVTAAFGYAAGVSMDGRRSSSGHGISADGTIVGSSLLPGSVNSIATMFFPTGEAVALGTLGGAYSGAYGVNDFRVAVGQAQTTGGLGHAFRYQNGAMSDLGTLGGTSSFARAVNNQGDVVGAAQNSAGRYRAFVDRGAGMVDLGALSPGIDSNAADLNEAGVIVGWSALVPSDGYEPYIRSTAFRWQNGVMTAMASVGQEASALSVNEEGTAVGYGRVGLSYVEHALMWTPRGEVIDLDVLLDQLDPEAGPYWTLTRARGINDSGLIAGYGTYDDGPGGLPDGAYSFFFNSRAIPESSSIAGLGFLWMLILPRQRR